MSDAEVFYDPDGGYAIRLTIGVPFAEDLVNIFAGYTEFAGDKLEDMPDYPDDYEPEDIARLAALRETASQAYSLLVRAYGEAIATMVYGPEDEADEAEGTEA